MHIQDIRPLTLELLRPLLDASTAEGYTFVQKLWDEYQSGVNSFSEQGALLLGGFIAGHFVAIGGVHPDPYLQNPAVGRIRHVYVLPESRRSGIGRALVQALIGRTSHCFSTFTLRTMTAHGQAFYEALGFSSEPRFASATHWLDV